jgi:hypothetical protein
VSKLRARIQRAELARQQQEAVDQATSGPSRSPRLEGARSAAGDPRRLRGIPVTGGCAGAMPGTRPDQTVR